MVAFDGSVFEIRGGLSWSMRLWYHIVTIEISPLVDFYLCCLRGSKVCLIMFWFLAALIDGF